MRPGSAERVFEVNVRRHRIVMEEALRAGVERVVHTSSAPARSAPRSPAARPTRRQTFTAGHLGIAYINSKHEAEVEALRIAARGLPLVVVNPTFVLGPDDPTGTSNGLIRRVLLRQIPFYVDGGLNVVDVRDVADGPPARRQQGQAGGALPARRPQLHPGAACSPTSAGSPASRRRRSRCRWGRRVMAAAAGRRVGFPSPVTEDELLSAAQWWTYRSTKAKKELGFKPRPHEETLEDAVSWQIERLGDRVGRAPRSDLALRALGTALRLGERVGLG